MLKNVRIRLKKAEVPDNKPNLHSIIACWKKKQKTKSLKSKLKRR